MKSDVTAQTRNCCIGHSVKMLIGTLSFSKLRRFLPCTNFELACITVVCLWENPQCLCMKSECAYVCVCVMRISDKSMSGVVFSSFVDFCTFLRLANVLWMVSLIFNVDDVDSCQIDWILLLIPKKVWVVPFV